MDKALNNMPGSDEQDLLRDRFLSYIFHELRTPLTVIHSYAQILQTRLPATPEFSSQRRISDQMIVQGDEVVEMIEELLEASRITLGRLDLDLIEYDFVELLEGLIEHLPTTTQERISWQTPSHTIRVMAEGPRLERALGAVLNFVLLVCQTAKLELSFDQPPLSPIVRLDFATDNWQPSSEEIEALFDLYRPVRHEQLTHSTLKAGNLDISLFVARGLIEGHQGKLAYEPTLPGFVVRLPVVL